MPDRRPGFIASGERPSRRLTAVMRRPGDEEIYLLFFADEIWNYDPSKPEGAQFSRFGQWAVVEDLP